MDHQHVLDQAQDFVTDFYTTHDTSKLIYHNLHHTQTVVADATRIANHYKLSEKEMFIVLTAAWFHDIGYLINIENHEEEGANLAEQFLSEHKVGHGNIKAIRGCIMATKMPQSPQSQLEEIICDADIYHLGTDDFAETDMLVMEEYNAQHGTEISKLEWRKKTIEFLSTIYYHTDYCQSHLTYTKQKNLEKLKKKVAKKESEIMEESGVEVHVPGIEGQPKTKKNKDEKPDKGIETMFRISSSNHQRLSDMADKKAHIMITVNSIILSAIISLVLRRLNEYGYLIIPSFMLLTTSILAMTFSILSTRPTIPMGIFTKEDVDNKKVNLLFFGNFYKMQLDDFNYGMRKMMEDADFLYGSLIKDLYAQGVVLGRKYHLLRIGYNIFMYGLIISVVGFIIASTFFSHNPPIK